MQYRLLISIEVIEFMERLPAWTRQVLRNGIAAIGRDPLGRSDAEDYDEIGRLLQIAIAGDYALTYWVDDADGHVKILDVHAADR
jgi:mRNA-degrading endonuclease RelE of RelBE toxin-antitoxin system